MANSSCSHSVGVERAAAAAAAAAWRKAMKGVAGVEPQSAAAFLTHIIQRFAEGVTGGATVGPWVEK